MGEKYSNIDLSDSEEATIRMIVDEIAKIKVQIEELLESEKALKEELLRYMEYYDIYDFETATAEVMYIKGTTYKRVDTSRLKAEEPEIYSNYTVDIKREPYVRMKLL